MNQTLREAYIAAEDTISSSDEILADKKIKPEEIEPLEICLEHLSSIVQIVSDAFPLVETGKIELMDEAMKKAKIETERCSQAYENGKSPFEKEMKIILRAIHMGDIAVTYSKTHTHTE